MENNAEQITYFTDPYIPDVLFIQAENSDKKWHNYHETYAVCHITGPSNGYSENLCRNTCHVATKGSVLLFEPGDYQFVRKTSAKGDFNVLLINPQVFVKCGEMLDYSGVPHLKTNHSSKVDLFHSLDLFFQKTIRGATGLEKQSLFVNCVEKIFETTMENECSKMNYAFTREMNLVQDYIHEFCTQRICLDELAGLAKMSKFHLIRSFKRAFGVPPHKYQIFLLIHHICQRLKQGLPVDITVFSDQSHFINSFKKIIGVTPNDYAVMLTGKKAVFF